MMDISWARILVQVTIYRRLLIGRDGHLDQSEACDISVREYGPSGVRVNPYNADIFVYKPEDIFNLKSP